MHKPASLMVWECISAHGMSGLHIFKGAIGTEAYSKFKEMYAVNVNVFSWKVSGYFRIMPHLIKKLNNKGR